MTSPANSLYFECGPLHSPIMKVATCRKQRKGWKKTHKTINAGISSESGGLPPGACQGCKLAIKLESGKVKMRTLGEISRRLAG